MVEEAEEVEADEEAGVEVAVDEAEDEDGADDDADVKAHQFYRSRFIYSNQLFSEHSLMAFPC